MSRRADLASTGFVSRGSRAFAVALVVLAGSPGIAAADGARPQANPEERAAALIRPAVVYLDVETVGQVRLPNGQTLSPFGGGLNLPFDANWSCTGFVVNPDGWVATAGHCVDPENAKDFIAKSAADAYIEQFPDSPTGKDPVATAEWLRKNARIEGKSPDRGPEVSLTVLYGAGTKLTGKLPASVVDFRPLGKGDVALLKVERHGMPSSELASDADVNIGTPILAVGFPETTQRVTGPSLDPTNKSGKVNKKSAIQTMPEYEIDAAVSEGMSGGPTIALDGRVIGVNSFAPVGEPQAFNFIAPVDRLAAMLAGKAVKPELGPADVYYRKGLSNYYSGRYSDAIKNFDQAAALSPDYPGLADLKTSAVNLRQQYGDVSVFHTSNLLWYIVSGILMLLVVGGWVAFMVLKSRRQRGTQAGVAALPEVVGRHERVDSPVAEPHVTATEPHYCANCGAQHHPAEKFCPSCGKHIELLQPEAETGQLF
ncbi:trypsin-like peptidase domain-containing protein [Mycobacterium sp. 050272]|uniref:trypsin-like peptidase domain-containing protein n=1 Tax=Mycobacterium sp. 050272 TaxID=3142488 RepID=UPI00318C8D0B